MHTLYLGYYLGSTIILITADPLSFMYSVTLLNIPHPSLTHSPTDLHSHTVQLFENRKTILRIKDGMLLFGKTPIATVEASQEVRRFRKKG